MFLLCLPVHIGGPGPVRSPVPGLVGGTLVPSPGGRGVTYRGPPSRKYFQKKIRLGGGRGRYASCGHAGGLSCFALEFSYSSLVSLFEVESPSVDLLLLLRSDHLVLTDVNTFRLIHRHVIDRISTEQYVQICQTLRGKKQTV